MAVVPLQSPGAGRRLPAAERRVRPPPLPALIAFGSGLAFASSTPPTDFQPGILLGLLGLAIALERGPGASRRSQALRGLLFGLGANLLALRFVPEVIARFTDLPRVAGYAALLLLSAAQSLPWAAAGAAYAWLAVPPSASSSRPAVPRWLAFAAASYLAGFVPAVFPWTPAGGLARWPVLLQPAELVGERGTSFLVALGCGLAGAAIVRALERAPKAAGRDAGLAVGVFALLLGYGIGRERAIDGQRAAAPHARIALVEPDFDPVFHSDRARSASMLAELTRLTKDAENAGAELTVWPESAYPYTLSHGLRASPRGERAILQTGVHGPVLTGIYLNTQERGVGTNSAILVEPDGTIGPSYDKRHLLWFGETVPLADTFPILRRVFARGTGLAAGTQSIRFEVGDPAERGAAGLRRNVEFAILNCYEDTLPAAGREAMAVRPNLLVNITNDAWFSGSAESELHLRLAVLRAIEGRRDLLRAVNRGPTTWVGAAGRVLARREAPPGAGAPPPLVVDAALLDTPLTLYARAGDAPLILLLLGALAVAWARAARRARARSGRAGAAT